MKIHNEHIKEVKITTSPIEALKYALKKVPYIVHLNDENHGDSFPMGAFCVENIEDIDDEFKEMVYRRTYNIPWDILETDRLRLREITVDDVPRLYELYKDEEITKYMEPLFADYDEEVIYTQSYIRNIYHFYGYGMWIVELKDSDTVIGRAGFEFKEDFDGLELGFMIGKDYQRQGYAYEICKAALEYGKKELEISDYRVLVDEENIASIRLSEKLGFSFDGDTVTESEMAKNGRMVEHTYLLGIISI